jgi:hypothetical protein
MFNSFKNIFNKNNMYDDISILYDIVDICDTYILVKRDNVLKQNIIIILNKLKWICTI